MQQTIFNIRTAVSKHFWRTLFSSGYISLGLLAFGLPTQTIPEIIVRSLFILLGIALLATFKNRQLAIIFLILGITILVGWLSFAIVLIASNFNDPFYRVHLFTLPLWFIFAVIHYKAITEISIESITKGADG